MRRHRVLILTPILFAATTLCASVSPAAASVLVNVDKTTQQMTVSVDGVARYHWPVSTGRVGWATPSGKFTAFRMDKDHFSKEFDDAPMPNSVFFTMKGHAIHGTNDTRHLGTAYSHGCVRLSVAHSVVFWDLVKEQGLPNVHVVITGKEQPLSRQPLVASRGRKAAPSAPTQLVPQDDQDQQAYASDPYTVQQRPVRDRNYYNAQNDRQVYSQGRAYRVIPQDYQEHSRYPQYFQQTPYGYDSDR
jgi:hypothetical protein